MAWLNRQAMAYAATTLAAVSMNLVMGFYYVKVYLHLFHISNAWFQLAQLVYMIWNALNDPLFGYLQDSSKILLFRKRGLTIMYGAPFYGLAFALTWFPWADPEEGGWLIGLQLLVVLCFYDLMLTVVILAQCALFTEMSEKSVDRQRLIRYHHTAGAIASVSVLFCETVSHNLKDFRKFQAACCVISFMSFVLMAYSGKNVRSAYDEQVTSEIASTSSQRQHSWLEVTIQIITQRNFIIYVLVNLVQIYHVTFGGHFVRIFCDHLISNSYLPSAWRSVFYGALPVLPRLMIIFGIPFLSKIGPRRALTYSYILKVVFGIGLLCCGSHPLAVIIFYLLDCTFARAIRGLSNLQLSDIIDEDKERFNRKRPVSSVVYGTHALITKPANSLAPMLTVAILNNYGYEELRASHDTEAAVASPELLSAMFYLICLTPVVTGLVQWFVWSFYRIPKLKK